jgi:hypothetical protein
MTIRCSWSRASTFLDRLDVCGTRLHRNLLISASILSLATGACSDSKTPDAEVFEDEAGVRHISVDSDVLTEGGYVEVASRWNAGGGTEGHFVDITAATRNRDGTFAVLDRFNKAVTIVGPEGRIQSTFGREGDGPAEFRDPRDIMAVEDQLLVWDLRKATFQAFTAEGKFLHESRLPEPGDLVSLTGRIDLELEDLSQRIAATPSGHKILVQLEENERELINPRARGTEDVRREGFIVAYDPALTIADTLIQYDAPTRSLSPGGPSYGPPIFSPRVTWAVDSVGLLYAPNALPVLHLLDFSGELKAEFRWGGKRRATSPEQRLAHVQSFYREQAPYLPTEVREQWDGNTSLQKQAAEQIVIADSTPVFSRIWLVSNCAVLAPFRPEDSSDGVGQRLAFVNLEDGNIVGRIALGEPGTDRLLSLSSSAILTKHTDSLGVQSASLFPVPDDIQERCHARPSGR